MFDPTAFENMKTVVEGAIYDKDLDGLFTILDRNDHMNLSKLSRTYDITFALKNQTNAKIIFEITANLQNLAAELLSIDKSNHLIGAQVTIRIVMRHEYKLSICQELQDRMEKIWGMEHPIVQEIRFDPLHFDNIVDNCTAIHFNRVVMEEQMDDLISMIDYMEESLWNLNSFDSLQKITEERK